MEHGGVEKPRKCIDRLLRSNTDRRANLQEPLELPQLKAVFPAQALHAGGRNPIFTLSWYVAWIRERLAHSGTEILLCLPQSGSKEIVFGPEPFEALWTKIATLLRTGAVSDIDSLVYALSEDGMLSTLDSEDSHRGLSGARRLVFAIIGWQTMLYTPDHGSCGSSQLAVLDDMDGYQGIARMAWKQSQSACRRPLSDFLLGFGVLLPSSTFSLWDTREAKKILNRYKKLEPASFNAFLFVSVVDITINWTDSLSCHLEFDETTCTLYLFRFPSFCVACLADDPSPNNFKKSVLHACSKQRGTTDQWATVEEVDQTLAEILLSYRVLFGQSKKGRQFFRKLNQLECTPQDPLLAELCGRKQCHFPIKPRERKAYDLARDFPIFRSKLVKLQHFASERKPRTWKQLWRDKRDSAQWFTFWAVIVIGGLGVLLAFLQVVLQILQLAIKS